MSAQRKVLVLRLHSLGDVVLSTGIVEALSARGESVDVATDAPYLPVYRGHPSAARLWTREDLLVGPAGTLRYDEVYDLQNTPGSRRLAARFGPLRTARLRPVARRWIVFWGDRAPRPAIPHAIVRYAEACRLAPGPGDGAFGDSAPAGVASWRPVVRVTRIEEAEARKAAPEAFAPGEAKGGAPTVALLTGASHRSKEYPAGLFLRVAEILRTGGARILWIAPPGSAPPDAWNRVGPVFRLPLGPLKAVLARSDLVVANDSGPMHLAEGLGVSVLALFGSSVAAFGFAPTGRSDRVLAVEDLACRPCGVHGRDRCWLGHWRCLRGMAPERVAAEATAMLAAAAAPQLPGPQAGRAGREARRAEKERM